MLKNLLVLLAALSMSAVANAEWTKGLSGTATGNISSTDNNPTVQDGETVSLSGDIKGNLDHKSGSHAWLNSLHIKEGVSKTPSLDIFTKSMDEIHIDTEYQYDMPSHSWLKFYARLHADSNLFKSEVVSEAPATYTLPDGSTKTTDRLRTADAFGVLTTRESIGFLAEIINSDTRKLNGRLGLGAFQIKAEDALNVDTDTGIATALEDADGMGLELELHFEEKLSETAKMYASVATLTPFDYSPENARTDDMDELELTDVTVTAGLESKLSEWLSMRYSYSAKSRPLAWQNSNFNVDHGFHLVANYTMF